MSRCLNCWVATSRRRSHSISSITQPLQSLLNEWLSIQELPTEGLICNACYVLLNQCAERGTHSRELGYPKVCIGCGCSVRGRRYPVRHHTLEENSPLIDIFFSWNTFNQDRRQILRACQACWMRANRHLAKKMPKTVAELDEIVEFVIKEEISDEDKRQCHLCLNIGRRMQELGDLALLYRKLLFENNYQNTTIPSSLFELPACWECLAELRRVRRFQEKVRRANAAFETGQNNNFGDFSNLSDVLIHEPISCVEPQETSTEDCAQNIKEEVCEEDVEESETLDSLDYKQEPVSPKMKSGCEEAETELHIEVAKDSTLQIETQSNTAVKRKVIESKTPQSEPKRSRTEQSLEDKPTGATTSLEGADTKTMEGLNCDSIFGKVKIEFDELQRTLKEQRNNESFKNMKYKCDNCVLGFSNYICLREHYTNLHDEVVGRFSCTVCDRRFVDEGQLSSHYRTHFVKFVCKLCNFECHTRTGRMTHFRKHKDSWETGDAKFVLRALATGCNKTSQAREFSKRMWKNVAQNLNSHRDGAQKDWKSWCKTSQQNPAVNSDASPASIPKIPVLCERRVQRPGTSRIVTPPPVTPPPTTPTQAAAPLSSTRPRNETPLSQDAARRALIRISERRAQIEEENMETLKKLVQE